MTYSTYAGLGSRIAQDVATALLMFTFLGLRIWILVSQMRAQHRGPLRTELVSLGCMVLCVCLVITEIGLASYDEYLGRNVAAADVLKFQQSPRILKLDFAQNYMHTLSMWIIRGSYLALFFEVRQRFPRRLQWQLDGTSVYIFCGFLASAVLHGVWCTPIDENWNLTIVDGKVTSCQLLWSTPGMGVLTALNLSADILILLLGTAVIRALQISWKVERAALSFILLVASLAAAASLARYAVQLLVNGDNVAEKGVQEMLIRLEIIFAVAAYGLAFPRAWLRPLLRRLKRVLRVDGKTTDVTMDRVTRRNYPRADAWSIDDASQASLRRAAEGKMVPENTVWVEAQHPLPL